jgi:hypothetical protein
MTFRLTNLLHRSIINRNGSRVISYSVYREIMYFVSPFPVIIYSYKQWCGERVQANKQ